MSVGRRRYMSSGGDVQRRVPEVPVWDGTLLRVNESTFVVVLLLVGGIGQLAGVVIIIWDLRKSHRRLQQFEAEPPLLRPVGKSIPSGGLFPRADQVPVDRVDNLEKAIRAVAAKVDSSIKTIRDELEHDLTNVDAFRRHEMEALRDLVLDLTRGGRLRMIGACSIILGVILATIGSVWSLTL